MHWVIQRSIFKPSNYDLLLQALDSLNVAYTSVTIKPGTYDLEPDVNPTGKVYVCGAIKLAKIANERGWLPGSLLNENFNFNVWQQHLGTELLNHAVDTGKLADIDTARYEQFFIRPMEDNKAFDGTVIDNEMLADWRSDPVKSKLLELDVMVSPVKDIYREYRLFVVNGRVVTGSLYKMAGRPQVSADLDDEVLAYAQTIISKWTPAQAFVMDVCLSEDGYKVIEFNNINSSGFYASDVLKYVDAIQQAFS
ncbi:ATP-grasp domain-containing protein [Undibacterium sp. TC4M20W]|uniref:ATP-grasp domain-containing protein n=1 Tax=Undibacterium sp. TC4M20W TaxID=3413052 RepID=UPI003BF29D34